MIATLDGDADTCVWAFASRDAAIALAKKLANEESDSGATEEEIANLHAEIDSLPDEGGVVFLTDNYAVKIEKVEVRR